MTRPNTPGPPPVPNELARRRGNPGKKSLPDEETVPTLPQSDEAPAPPAHLGPQGVEVWNEVWGNGLYWVSQKTDYRSVRLLAELHDERWALREVVLTEGDWRQRSQLRSVDKQIIDLLCMLGMTPADRTRLGVAEVRVVDDMEAFRKRAAGKAEQTA